MAANGGSPALININLSIAETITAIDKIVERIAARKAAQQQDFFADLRDNLDVIYAAVNALDNMFVVLVDAYSDKDIIDNPGYLKELGQLTKSYLTTYQIVQRFEPSKGAIQGAANDPHISAPQLKTALSTLSWKLEEYRNSLGFHGITSGIGWQWLLPLYQRAEQSNWVLDAQGKADILALAYNALNVITFELSGEIRRLIGQARLYARA
jgi:hypothetical protein